MKIRVFSLHPHSLACHKRPDPIGCDNFPIHKTDLDSDEKTDTLVVNTSPYSAGIDVH